MENTTKTKPSFDQIFMDLAVNLSQRSHCVRRHVGAVLTKDTRIISIGYNGPPAGTKNCDIDFEDGCPKDSQNSCSLAMHAEQNAILYATSNGAKIEGSTIYVTLSPCMACARIILSTGIKKVIYKDSYAEYKGLDVDEGIEFLKEFGIEVEKFIG